MSEPIEKTAAGATRALLGALGFILLMVGVEGMNGHPPSQLLVDVVLALAGALCFYLAFFWESAKRHLSPDTQEAIGQFAQSRVVKFGMLFLLFETIILSRFVEGRRWPFSYPATPATYAEINTLRGDLNTANAAFAREKEFADKWRFTSELRHLGPTCRYQLQFTSKASGTAGFWQDLFQGGGWSEFASAVALSPSRPGITIRIATDTGIGSQCAGLLQKALTDIYPNPASRVASNQQTDFLRSCGPECVQIEIDY